MRPRTGGEKQSLGVSRSAARRRFVEARWTYRRTAPPAHHPLHVIEETARHDGHADLVRERIDNTTGYLPLGLRY